MTKEELKLTCKAIPSPIDERDYSINKLVTYAIQIPKEYRINFNVPVLNQGSIGCCVACSLSAIRYIREYIQNNTKNSFSVAWIYGNRKRTDLQGEGMVGREALKNLQECGVCLWDSLPDYLNYPNAKNKVTFNKQKLRAEALKYKIDSYYACKGDSEIKKGILECGAVTATFPAYDELFNTDRNGIVKTITNKSKYDSHHQMTIVGWRIINSRDYWIVLNSWGTEWGDKGYCYIPMKGYPMTEAWATIDNIK